MRNRSPFWTFVTGLLPRPLAAIVAILGVAWAFGYAIREEVPVGGVRGQVLLDDTIPMQPLEDADIILEPVRAKGKGAATKTRYTLSLADGTFRLAHVPAGDYYIMASSHAHSAENTYLTVSEGSETQVTLMMKRSQADLKLNQHQRVFGSKEKANFSVSGYVDGDKSRGKDTLDVRVYATRLSNVLQHKPMADALEEIGRSYEPANKLPDALLKPGEGVTPRRVKQESLPITGADREGFFYRKLDFGALPTGLYLVDVKHDDDSVCAWLLVTDTALVLKKASKQLIAYAVDMQAGTPIPNSSVRTYRKGRIVAEGVTDSRGLVEMTLPEPPNNEGREDRTALTTVALRGDDEAVVWQNEYNNEDSSEFVLNAYTDRPIYRPGQKIAFKGIARRRFEPQNGPGIAALNAASPIEIGPNYAVPAGKSVAVEIRDPSGERILQETKTTNRYGSFFGSVELNPEAATGVYTMVMRVNGEESTHDIVVASYRKPEFAVTVTPEKKRVTRGDTVTMTISAQYYFGAPVAGAKVRYYVYHAPDWEAEYPDDYGFEMGEDEHPSYHDSEGETYGETAINGVTTLDESGKAIVTFPTTKKGANDASPQQETYSVNVTVIESANREVSADGNVTVTAGDFRLTVSPEGYVAMSGQPLPVTLTARDHDGNPVPNVPVDLEFGYEKWTRNTSEYKYEKAGTLKANTGTDGRVVVPITPNRAGELTLKARAYDAHAHLLVGRASLWAASDDGSDSDSTYADLTLLTDKRRYSPGDTARVLINSERVGQSVLLTIEGDRVYRTQLIPMAKHSSVVRVPILAEYGPNISLVACYVCAKKFARSETPLRVQTPARDLKLTITADRSPDTRNPTVALARYQPGEKITYQVLSTDAQGRPTPCEFSFGVVDEAIYALREDDPTALRDAFYPRRTNRVETKFSFEIVYQGDADKAEPQITARKKFPDTAFWEPVLETNAEGRAVVSFTLPDNLTTWRATATAHTLETRLGRATQKVYTSKDFFVRVETPRSLTQRDQSQIMALIHNETGQPQMAMVKLVAGNLNISGNAEQSVTLEPGKIGKVVWAVTADGFGKADLRVTAWTTQGGASQFTDGVEMSLPIRIHGREMVTAFAGEVLGEHPETEVLRLEPDAVPQATHLTVRITPSLAGALTPALDYLIGYPYGCTEQTMSRILPDLLVQRALRQHGMPPPENASELPRMIRTGLQRLYRFQHSETGGWGWWEHDSDDPWMTAYVLYGLAVAKSEGYPVSKNALAKGKAAAVKLAAQMKSEEKAFLLYALALCGDADAARDLRSGVELKFVGPEGLSYLLLVDRLIGQSSPQLYDSLNQQIVSENGMLYWKARKDSNGSDLSATTTALRALLAQNPQDPRIGRILRWLMWKRTGEYWSNTRDTSWVLAALCDTLATQPDSATPSGEVRIRLNGSVIQTYALTPDLLRQPELTLRVPAPQLRSDKNDVTIERVGGGSPVFYSVELKQTTPKEDLPAFNPAQFTISREYLRVVPKKAGQAAWTLQTEPTNNQLQVGDRIQVRLTIYAPTDLAYVLIEDPFPAGCEVTERGDAEEIVDWGYWWSSTDVRDDRIAFFARDLSKGKHVIEYNLRAQTPGNYHTLPTLLQAMYAPETRAEAMETRVEIK